MTRFAGRLPTSCSSASSPTAARSRSTSTRTARSRSRFPRRNCRRSPPKRERPLKRTEAAAGRPFIFRAARAAPLDSPPGRTETRITRKRIFEEAAMIRTLFAAAFVSGAALAPSAPAQGADPNLGRNLAAACATCHGTNGASRQGMPNLAGQQRSYLVQQMQDFRAGKRPATIMHQIARGYTDEQIDALAAYFSEQRAR